jgi:hypothetical protein
MRLAHSSRKGLTRVAGAGGPRRFLQTTEEVLIKR